MSFLPRRRIVAPVDFSDRSREVVATASEIAGAEGQIHVIHVLPELNPADPGVVWETVDDRSRIQKTKQALHETYASQAKAAISFEAVIGDPGHAIAALAERISADLIVIGSHGRTGMKRLLIGSVAERVVRLSHCPVLVMRH